jgi:ribosomal protein S18 acetylase RimI-like enzyme
MQIRKATLEDRKYLLTLVTNFETNTGTRLPKELLQIRAYKDTEQSIKETVDQLFSKPGIITFIALDDNQPLGFIFGEIKEKKEKVYDKEGYIDSWYVEPEHQATGIGKALFEKLVEEFEKAQCTHLALNVHFDNARAIKIYESMGFTKRVISFIKPLKNLL